jgi:hypothetical protein
MGFRFGKGDYGLFFQMPNGAFLAFNKDKPNYFLDPDHNYPKSGFYIYFDLIICVGITPL